MTTASCFVFTVSDSIPANFFTWAKRSAEGGTGFIGSPEKVNMPDCLTNNGLKLYALLFITVRNNNVLKTRLIVF